MENNIINSFKTISEVENYKNSVIEECNSRIEFIKMVKKADELSNKSFGYIKECFEAISPELFNTKGGKTILNKYLSTIKGNKNLSIMHGICEGIRKAGKETDYPFFMNKMLETNNGINKSTLKEDVKSVGMVLAEGYLYVGKKAEKLLPAEDKKLYTALDYITENEANLKHMTEYSNAMNIIKEHIENKDSVANIFEAKNLEELASELLEEFNKKYSDTLSEDEAIVLKEIASSENREEVFNKYKEMCLNKINEAKNNFVENGDDKSSKRLDAVLEQVNNKKFSLDTIGEDICNLMELSNIFE